MAMTALALIMHDSLRQLSTA